MSTSSTEVAFAEVTRRFLQEAGYSVDRAPDGVDVVSDDFALRFEVRRSVDGVLEVRSSERAGAPRPRVAGGAVDDVQRWLMLLLRGGVRRSKGLLGPVSGPPGDGAAPGLDGAHDGDDVVVSDRRGVRLRFFRVSRTDPTWVQWTHLADRPLAEVAARLATEAGW